MVAPYRNPATPAPAPYRPPTNGTLLEVPWLSLVTRADPNWARDRHHEIQYAFTGRTFYCDPDVDGPYNPNWDNPIIPLPNYLMTSDGQLILNDNGRPITTDVPQPVTSVPPPYGETP